MTTKIELIEKLEKKIIYYDNEFNIEKDNGFRGFAKGKLDLSKEILTDLKHLTATDERVVEIKYRNISSSYGGECPDCFVFNFYGDRYCRHCGAKIKRVA